MSQDDPREWFELTAEHLTLIANMGVGWQECEYGAPEVNPKRPYGNSDVEGDVGRLLGWAREGDDGGGPCWSSAQRRRAAKLHRETETALQVVLCNLSVGVRKGLYRQQRSYDRRSWVCVEERL